MSYNGSGTFNINTSGQPVVTGTVISSTAFNALTADLAAGLTNAMTRDGQSPATGDIPMGGNKLTGVAAASASVLTDGLSNSFTHSGTGATTRALIGKLRDSVSVFDFMTSAQVSDVQAGTLTENVSTAIQAAFDAHDCVMFPAGKYWMGSHSSADTMVDLSSLGDGVQLLTEGDVEFVCQTTASVIPVFFNLKNNNHFHCGPVRFRDTGYDSSIDWKGAFAFVLNNDTSSNWGDVTFEAIYCKTMVGAVRCYNGDATHRVRGIHIGHLYSDDCYYGVNFQNQGDGLTIDSLVAYQNYRPYYVYGIDGHKVNIFNRNNRMTSGAVNISRSVGGYNTTGINVRYVCRDTTVALSHVLINHIDLLGGTISGIDIDLDIEGTTGYGPVRFVNYTGAGGSETSGASSNIVNDIHIKGQCDSNSLGIITVATYSAATYRMYLEGSKYLYVDGATYTAMKVVGNYVLSSNITWTASSVSPAIGDGTFTARTYVSDGYMAYTTVSITMGSTTTYGTGEWYFTSTVPTDSMAMGSALLFDTSAGQFTAGVCRMPASSAIITVYRADTAQGSGIGSAVPFTWAVGDTLNFTIQYQTGLVRNF